MRFSQNDKKVMVHHLKLKKAHINGLNFLWKFKKPYFSDIFRLFPHIGFSPKNFGIFLTFRHIVSQSRIASPIFLIFYPLDQSGLDFPQKFQ